MSKKRAFDVARGLVPGVSNFHSPKPTVQDNYLLRIHLLRIEKKDFESIIINVMK